jgi:hypothetical protein
MDADRRQVVEWLTQTMLCTMADETEGTSALLGRRSPNFRGA